MQTTVMQFIELKIKFLITNWISNFSKSFYCLRGRKICNSTSQFHCTKVAKCWDIVTDDGDHWLPGVHQLDLGNCAMTPLAAPVIRNLLSLCTLTPTNPPDVIIVMGYKHFILISILQFQQDTGQKPQV